MLNYLALGDSYTIGEAVSVAECWPVQLTEKLKQSDIAIADPAIIATTGWTTGELLAAIARENPGPEYHLVSLLIGVNNQYRGYDLDIFRVEFTELLQKSIYFARKKPEGVLVLSIPDYGVTPFAATKEPARISQELEVYNKLQADICERFGVRFYNITDISKQAARDTSLLAADELHPSGSMYRLWTEHIYPHVVKQIKLLQKV